MPPLDPLPIDAHLAQVVARARERGALVLTADPGSGKTTRVPWALADALGGQVVVLEPRRLAVRLAARRVAAERGVRPGGPVGWQVRFDAQRGPDTRVLYVTEGVLVRRLVGGDDGLRGVSAVVLDELHERHVETDLALTLLERLRRTRRPDLVLVAMSATLEAAPVARLLDADVLEVAAPGHPLELSHAPNRDDRPLEDRVTSAVADLVDAGLAGHALVFLPGAGEIARCARALEGVARRGDLAVLPLHGRLEPDALEAALAPSRRRKVLLATNVAESSVTIDGVTAVVDAGLARVPGISPAGLPTLELQPISQFSARQRAGRAARQGPGRCVRLYTRNDHDRRPRAVEPELLRSDLGEVALALRGAGVRDLGELRWLDPPPPAALAAADHLLRRLGALDAEGAPTETGRALLRLPLAPRLGRVLLEGHARGVGQDAALAVALLSERDVLAGARGAPGGALPDEDGPCDLLPRLDLLRGAWGERGRGGRTGGAGRPGARDLRALGLVPEAVAQVDRVRRQLEGLLPRQGAGAAPESPAAAERALLQALLAGHPDRVCRRARPGAPGLALADGGQAELARESVVRDAAWLVALDAQDPRRPGALARVHLASALAPDWLIELFSDALVEERVVRWNAAAARVEGQWRLRYGALVVEEAPDPGDPAEVEALLRREARAAGAAAFGDAEALAALRARAAFARTLDPALPELDDALVLAALDDLCAGARSFAELRERDLLAHVRGALGPDGPARLERLAPTHVGLRGGRRLEVHYEPGRPPWVASRLQDFFGMSSGPAVGQGRVPLVLHLLAPNKTAVSITSDLAGFWTRHYPAARRELQRRYPRHAWPDDPATAEAPRPGRNR